MKVFKLTLTIVAVACFVVTTAQATSFTSTQSGNWRAGATWGNVGNVEGTHFPGAGDNATVAAGDTVHVDATSSCANLTVDDVASGNPAVLEMRASGVLEVSSSISVDTGTVDGQFLFVANSGTQPRVVATGPAVALSGTFGGTGTQGGEFGRTSTHYFDVSSGSAEISCSPQYITVPMQCSGGTLELSGQLENDQSISANGGDITISGTMHAGSSGLFEVTNGSSTLWLCPSCSSSITSGADFHISAGLMRFSQTITTTTGGYQQTGGTCQVDATYSFTAAGAY
jgi:hypothetical protein